MKRIFYHIIVIILLSNCKNQSKHERLFTFIPVSTSNRHYENTIVENDDRYPCIFIKGGVLFRRYSESTPSYILNNNKGTLSINKNIYFSNDRMVTDTIWEDIIGDIKNLDGFRDVLIVENNLSTEVNYDRHDAMIWMYLKGSKNGFIPIKSQENGFLVPRQSIHIISVKNKIPHVIATQNNDSIRVFKIKNKENDILEKIISPKYREQKFT